MRHQLIARKNVFSHMKSRLHLLSPQNVLARGYSITTDAISGRIIRKSGEVQPGSKLRTKVEDGEIRSVVEGETRTN